MTDYPGLAVLLHFVLHGSFGIIRIGRDFTIADRLVIHSFSNTFHRKFGQINIVFLYFSSDEQCDTMMLFYAV